MSQLVEKTVNELGHEAIFRRCQSECDFEKFITEVNPDLVICPFLKTKIPKQVYEKVKCLIVHPGIVGDRGAHSIDWAIIEKKNEWGVTIMEAAEEMDAGDIWASGTFEMPTIDNPLATKSTLYNSHIIRKASELVRDILTNKFGNSKFRPQKLEYSKPDVKGRLMPNLKQSDVERNIDWNTDDSWVTIKKARAADGQPGVKATLK